MTTLKSDLLFMESIYLSLEPTMLDEGLGDLAKGALHKAGKFGAGLAAAGAMMAGPAAPAHAMGALPNVPRASQTQTQDPRSGSPVSAATTAAKPETPKLSPFMKYKADHPGPSDQEDDSKPSAYQKYLADHPEVAAQNFKMAHEQQVKKLGIQTPQEAAPDNTQGGSPEYKAWQAKQAAMTPEEKESARQWDAFSERQQARYDANNKKWDDMNDRVQARQQKNYEKFSNDTRTKMGLRNESRLQRYRG